MKYFFKSSVLFVSGMLITLLSLRPGLSTNQDLNNDENVQKAKNIVVTAPKEAALLESFTLLDLGEDPLAYVFDYFNAPDLRSCALSCKLLQDHSYNAPMYTALLIKSNLCEKDGKRFEQDSGKKRRDIFMIAVENKNVLARIALADFYRDGNFIRPDSAREANALKLGTTKEEHQTALKKLMENNKNLVWKLSLRHYNRQTLDTAGIEKRISFLNKYQPDLDSENCMDPSDKIRFKFLFYKHALKFNAPNYRNLSEECFPLDLRDNPAIYPEDRAAIDLEWAKDFYIDEGHYTEAFQSYTRVSQDPTAWRVHRIEADYQRALMGAKGFVTSLSVTDVLNLIKKVKDSGLKADQNFDKKLEKWVQRKTGKLSSKKQDQPPSPSEEEKKLLKIGHNIFKESKTSLSPLDLKALDCLEKFAPKIYGTTEPRDPDFADSSEDETPSAFEDEEAPSQSDEEDTPPQ